MTEPQTNVLGRNGSMREPKAPLGPRPADFSPSKSYAFPRPPGSSSEVVLTSHHFCSDNSYNPPPSHVPFPPTPPTLAHDPTNDGPAHHMFDFGDRPLSSKDRGDARAGSLDLLPTVNFDEFHRSIKTNELPLRPELASRHMDRSSIDDARPREPASSMVGRDNSAAAESSTARLGRSASLRRQTNASVRNGHASGLLATAAASDQPRPIRTQAEGLAMIEKRRALTQQNRKSVGPGLLDMSFPGDKPQPPRPMLEATSMAREAGQPINFRRANQAGVNADSEQPRLVVISRNNRTKSFHATPGQEFGDPSKPTITPEPPRSPSTTTARSSAKSPGWNMAHPASAAKRFSMVPPHATGLGARTISPTDARRMKRLSMMPNPPPLPDAPPTPYMEVSGARPTAHSPSWIPRKSSTPSSSRTTPDPNRKPSAAGLPVASGTPQGAARQSTGPLPARLSQISLGSRLPTARPKDVRSSASSEEVPPVPAIPKAYESPKDIVDRPYFGAAEPLPGLAPNGDFTGRVSVRKTSLEASSDAHRRAGLGIETEHKPRTASSLNKRHLQPLQLPPLNVLPLSGPTVDKLSAIQDPAADGIEGRSTPHAKRGAKTPTTPMTASKATFFSRFRTQDEAGTASVRTRSSSSNLLRASETAALRAMGISDTNGLPNDMVPSGQSAVMPPAYSSNVLSVPSVPPGSDSRDPLPNRGHEPFVGNAALEPRPVRVNGPRAPSFKANSGDQWMNSTSATGAHTPSSASSLRRKWSLSFRRSSSKASNVHGDSESVQTPQVPKHDQMPPPRLPPSAPAPPAAAAAASSAPSPPAPPKSRSESRNRKSSATSLVNGFDRTQGANWASQPTTRGPPRKEPDPRSHILESTRAAARISPSMAPPSQSSLSSKGSSNSMLKDQELDRDDLSAEEEMRKITGRRKDFEMAAHEMDDLRRRANPKEKVTPAQALRVVNLNIFERGEIVDYKDVYFCGTQTAKKHVGELNEQSTNFGYDDERGDYNIIPGDHLAYRYEIIDVLGKGSFGQVVRCVDHKSGGLVAIKIIRNKKRFHQQALVEVNILRKLREWVSFELRVIFRQAAS